MRQNPLGVSTEEKCPEAQGQYRFLKTIQSHRLNMRMFPVTGKDVGIELFHKAI